MTPRFPTQRELPFLARSRRREARFKRAILLATLAVVAAVVGLTPRLRFLALDSAGRLQREVIRRLTGLEPTEDELDAARSRRRDETERSTRDSLTRYYESFAPPEIRALFDAAAMSPTTGLIGVGRATNGFLLSSDVFAPDPARSYRFRPNTASVWLRQVTLHNGPFGLFLVPDTPSVRAAASAAGAIVDETSRQTTNSWGLRGPEPDPAAPLRGIVLGDSFMQGMFNDDDHTPPLDLERALTSLTGRRASILNTGHIGYAPEQYYRTLEEYGPRFDPHFVVVSVCPNDLGDENRVLEGNADDLDEAARWLNAIAAWCRGRNIPVLVVLVPIDRQVLGIRRPGRYPDPIIDRLTGIAASCLDPFESFLDEHLRLRRESDVPSGTSLLYNAKIHDNHFSPAGSRLWADLVARRLVQLVRADIVRVEPPRP
jgi:lysophospholipase L1-like esterase